MSSEWSTHFPKIRCGLLASITTMSNTFGRLGKQVSLFLPSSNQNSFANLFDTFLLFFALFCTFASF